MNADTSFRRQDWHECCQRHSYDVAYSVHYHGAVLVRCWQCGGDIGYVYPSFEKKDARLRELASLGFRKQTREEAIDTDTTTSVMRDSRRVQEQNEAVQDWLYEQFNIKKNKDQ